MEVTYEYYQDSYGGSQIPESRWKTLETKSQDETLHAIAEVHLSNTGLMDLVVDEE